MPTLDDVQPQDHGQGRVKDPAHDGRLKANRERGVSLGTTRRPVDVLPAGRGRVKHPERDGRLKQNRDRN